MISLQVRFKKYGIYALGVLFLMVIVLILYSYYSPVKPEIKITSAPEFNGGHFVLEGQVIVDCYCDIELKLSEENLILDKDGNFSKNVTIAEGQHQYDYILKAISKGKFINRSSEYFYKSGIVARIPTEIDLSSSEKELSGKTARIKLSGKPGTKVELKAFTSLFVLDTYSDKSSEELESKQLVIDESGTLEVPMTFKNTYNNRSTIYKVVASSDGYAPNKKNIEVKNLNFDEERMKKEKDEWQKQKEIEKIRNSMETYSGAGDIKIAINKDIKKSRNVGYRYTLDPNNYQFVSFALSVKYVGYSSAHVNPNYVTVQDEDGRIHNYDEATYSYGNYFDATNLQANTYTSGYLAFILPKSHHKFTVIYDDGSNVVKKEIYVD